MGSKSWLTIERMPRQVNGLYFSFILTSSLSNEAFQINPSTFVSAVPRFKSNTVEDKLEFGNTERI